MGDGAVLNTTTTITATSTTTATATAGTRVRAFAHCQDTSSSVAVALINFDQRNAAAVALPSAYAAALRQEYVLTPCGGAGASGIHSACVALNGKPLAPQADGTPPTLTPSTVSAETEMALPPGAIAFASVPAPSGVCGG